MAQYIGLVTYILSAIGAYQYENATPTPIPPEPTATRVASSPTPIPRPTLIPTRPNPTPTRQPQLPPTTNQGRTIGQVTVTRYGTHFNGLTMACGGTYSSNNPSILAVPLSRYSEFPCGTKLILTNPRTGVSLSVTRTDGCGGCGYNHFDLSEAGIAILCGGPCDILEGIIVSRP